MKQRTLGKTGIKVSEISLGTWQLGNAWGKPFDLDLAHETLDAANECKINCLDTADVYSGGKSEETIGHFYNHKEKPFIITKIGRRSNPHTKAAYNKAQLAAYIEDSKTRLQQKQLDLVLLHCPPSDVYEDDTVFNIMDDFVKEGKIKHYGVSIETIEEGYKAIEHEGVSAVEIIFNMFRLKPLDGFFDACKRKHVGIIVRVPLASGLLSGKYDKSKTFAEGDHRYFNRDGKSFDKGETFSGVDFDLGLEAVNELKTLFKSDNLAPIALRYILMFDAVSTVIPGASRPEQVYQNVRASGLEPLTDEQMAGVKAIYDKYIRKTVHHLW